MRGRVTRRQPPRGGTLYKEQNILRFGGLNNRDASIHIEDFQASDLMNVHFDNKGEITKRNGFTALNATAIDGNPIISTFPFYKSNGSKYILATSGTSIYNVTSGTPVSIKTGLTGSAKRFSNATYQDKVYMVNGTDGVMKWDGTTFSTVTGLPFTNVNYIVLHKNRMYYVDAVNPSRLWMSDLGAPDTVQVLDFIDVNTNDGDVITGIAEHLDSLVIFKERSIHVLRGTGPQNYNVLDSHQAHGTISHWSIVPIMNKLYYLARDGVYAFDGHNIHLESDLIKGSVIGLNNNQAWNQQYLGNACAIEYKNKYWLSLTEGTAQVTNNRIYLFDYIHGYWTRYDIPVSCFSLFQSSTSATYDLFSGSPSNGKVYKQDTGTSDDGAMINAYFKTKDFDFGATAHFKAYKGLYFAAEQQLQNYSINITYIQDRGRKTRTVPLNLGGSSPSQWGTFVWGTDPWGSKPNMAKKITAVAGQSKYLSFKVSDNSTNPWIFLGWVIRYQVKRRLA